MLPFKDHRYLESRGLAFEEIVDGAQQGVVLRGFPLPTGLFDTETANVLVVLPTGYPDAPPDMFFTKPWLKLKSGGGYPSRADSSFDFGGKNWQRWSRHNNEWRPGTDGIWTTLKRVETALLEAG